jgi:hypothetical protein
MTIEIHHLAVSFLEGQFRSNFRRPRRKNRQLNLGYSGNLVAELGQEGKTLLE